MRSSHQRMTSIGTALAVALLSFTVANAGSASDNTAPNWDEVFAQAVGDQTTVWKQNEWRDFSALGYAKPRRADAAALPWVPLQQMPAVDGINGKIAGYGGGAPGSTGFYGTAGSFSVPLGQQWGLQIDGDLGSDTGIGYHQGAAHLFWRDPSIALFGAYVSYMHDNGIDDVVLGHISTSVQHYAAEGELYLNRWTLSGQLGVEMVSVNSGLPALGLPAPSVPNRFFDDVSVSYYITDNFRLSAGHAYTVNTHFLTLGTEYGIALGGGRMASLFADGWIGEGGNNGALAGLRIYFGQRDKTLIDRQRQDDPGFTAAFNGTTWIYTFNFAPKVPPPAASAGPLALIPAGVAVTGANIANGVTERRTQIEAQASNNLFKALGL